jgi:hypothetical protein
LALDPRAGMLSAVVPARLQWQPGDDVLHFPGVREIARDEKLDVDDRFWSFGEVGNDRFSVARRTATGR